MTREEHFEDIKVVKGNHWCEICDAEADFVIVDTTAYGIGRELSLCKKCAEMLKGKIDIGMKLWPWKACFLGKWDDYMKYYRVRSERTGWFSHYFTKADELFTEKERNSKVRYITDFWFEVVNIS